MDRRASGALALDLLARLLREPARAIDASDVADWWRRFCARAPGVAPPVDRAVLGGFLAGGVGFAFAAGYQAALRALVPSLPAAAIASFCATEAGGNHPRAIETRLERRGTGLVLDGAKRWSTMGTLASVLLVVASEGEDAGRKRFRLVAVRAPSPGLEVGSMPPPKFVPEVPHASLALRDVAVADDAVLPGDGYTRYVKPFRTVEDVHVHAALLGYLVSAARRLGFPREIVERLAAAVTATRALAALDPGAPETHVALAGLLADGAALRADVDRAWAGVEGAERERWERDRAMFGAVAAEVRERRRRRAWEALESGGRAQA